MIKKHFKIQKDLDINIKIIKNYNLWIDFIKEKTYYYFKI